MKRRMLALALCLALCMGLAAPALAAADKAEAAADEALMAVTAKVKDALALDTERFDYFQGWSEEDVLLGKRWNLEWSADGVSLSITADDSGKVYGYNLFESVDSNTPAMWYGGKLNIPRLPQDKSGQAFATAQDFLSKVLVPGLERVELENTAVPALQQTSYRFSGTILLNGLTSPITCSVTVRASDLAVTRFYRNDQYSGYLGGVPDPSSAIDEARARELLRATIDMRAEYVLEPGSKTAVLRYVPISGDSYYVDAKSGQLINLTELYKKLWAAERGGSGDKLMNSMATAQEAAADMAAGLTQAERDGAAILANAMSREELDSALKNAWPEMGLHIYTLSTSNYSIREKDIPDGAERTPDDYDVSCRLTYAKEEGQTIRYKYVTADAKTGQLQSLWSTRSYRGDDKDAFRVTTSFEAGQTKALTALRAFAGSNAEAVSLADSSKAAEKDSWQHIYTYQQKSGDWFYPGNCYTIGIDATDGTLSRMDGYFDEEVILQVPDQVISKERAIDAYLAALDAPYGYLEVPVSISLAGSDVMPLLKEAGYSYVTALKNGYTLSHPTNAYVEGVYAETGKAIVNTFDIDRPGQLTYDDLEGHWVKTAADALAVFGIGLRGGSLKPGDALTQLDMVALLASVDGYTFDPTAASRDETDWLYRYAYSLGLVTPETRQEDKTITRGELVKLILDSAGYERIAALPGIFRCDFADAASLDGATMGYAALAQGLGLVKGGSDGAYAPGRQITRAEAVAMLYQYMK